MESNSDAVIDHPPVSELIDSLGKNYPRSVRRGIAHAIKLSFQSKCPHYKVGAVLIKNGNILASGRNWFRKTAPDSLTRHQGIHAEFHCLRASSLAQTDGAILFVARTTLTGDISMAKPCDCCQLFLKALKLKKIFYTDRDGSIAEMVLA